MKPALLRAAAIVIAVLGVIDPAITSERRTRPEVAVVGDEASSELTEHVAKALESSLTVVRGPFTNAAATVVVGRSMPAAVLDSRKPAIAVTPARDLRIAIEHVQAPRVTSPDAHARVSATVSATEAAGRSLEVTLQAGGVVLDRAIHNIDSTDARLDVPLTFVPVTSGTNVLRVTARITDSEISAAADVAIDVRDQRFAVLFFDHRPSWQSTFVRRTVEDDPRFSVTSRVITSRNISTDAGRPPATLTSADALAVFDVIVVGAPELLDAADVHALERFMRQRGGTVVLLLDHAARGPFEQLTGVTAWTGVRRGRFTLRPTAGPDTAGLIVGEANWPVALPAAAVPVASASRDEPVVWRTAIGAGRLVVSGALDAWRFRDGERSGFQPFWRGLLAAEAASALPAIDIEVPGAPLRPGEAGDVVVTVRPDATNEVPGGRVTTSIPVTYETAAGQIAVRTWLDEPAGRFRGAIHAPREPGVYRITAEAGGAVATAFVTVVNDAMHAQADHTAQLGMWVSSRGGRVVDGARLKELPDEVARLVQPESRAVLWHPMRSAWWILPFVLLLGIDWWFRRNLTASPATRSVSNGSGRDA